MFFIPRLKNILVNRRRFMKMASKLSNNLANAKIWINNFYPCMRPNGAYFEAVNIDVY